MSKGKTRTESVAELPAWQQAQFQELFIIAYRRS